VQAPSKLAPQVAQVWVSLATLFSEFFDLPPQLVVIKEINKIVANILITFFIFIFFLLIGFSEPPLQWLQTPRFYADF
jgi:hypothetical protein